MDTKYGLWDAEELSEDECKMIVGGGDDDDDDIPVIIGGGKGGGSSRSAVVVGNPGFKLGILSVNQS